MRAFLIRLAQDRSGATAIEYGLIAAFVALAIFATLPSIRTNVAQMFADLNTGLSSAARGQ